MILNITDIPKTTIDMRNFNGKPVHYSTRDVVAINARTYSMFSQINLLPMVRK